MLINDACCEKARGFDQVELESLKKMDKQPKKIKTCQEMSGEKSILIVDN